MAEYIELDALMKYPIRIDHYDKEHGNKDFVLGIESVLEYAEALPAADVVEVVHGRWIPTPEYDSCWCSCCKKQYTGFFASGWNYCPNCGARMDGE